MTHEFCFDFEYLGSEHEEGVYLLINILTPENVHKVKQIHVGTVTFILLAHLIGRWYPHCSVATKNTLKHCCKTSYRWCSLHFWIPFRCLGPNVVEIQHHQLFDSKKCCSYLEHQQKTAGFGVWKALCTWSAVWVVHTARFRAQSTAQRHKCSIGLCRHSPMCQVAVKRQEMVICQLELWDIAKFFYFFLTINDQLVFFAALRVFRCNI